MSASVTYRYAPLFSGDRVAVSANPVSEGIVLVRTKTGHRDELVTLKLDARPAGSVSYFLRHELEKKGW